MKSFDQIKKKQHPKTSILTEEDISQYVMDRFEEAKQEHKMVDLVKFHSINKYLLMAHNPEKLKILGNIVANHKKIKIKQVIENYEKCLREALDCKPTVNTHTNALLHIFGFFGKFFNQKEKTQILRMVHQYKKSLISLEDVLSEIEPITYQFNNTYLISQTYFLLYSRPAVGHAFDIYDKPTS